MARLDRGRANESGLDDCRGLRGLRGRARGIRTLGAARACLGGIRPEFGALFSPNKSIRAGENLFAWGLALLRISPVPFVRQADARNPVRSKHETNAWSSNLPPRRAVSKSEPQLNAHLM
jgi:hypothetical protein